jgi:2',3'-cyclic-nucleotide 2'-phosphodiesterase (5'-nucleotidase family)
MSNLDFEVFKNKKFSSILEEIYENQKKKSKQINALINELKPLINDIGDATLIVPLIKEYLEIDVKNDDQLVKLATIIQRITVNSAGKSDSEFGISDAEKEQLMKEIDKINKDK